MKPKRQSFIQHVLMLPAVLAMLCCGPVVAGSLKGAAEKLIDQRLQSDSRFSTAGSKPSTLAAGQPNSAKGDTYGTSRFLSFPLPLDCGDVDVKCKFPYSEGAYTPNSINSVLDHSMDKPYYPPDGKVTAFTGEIGKGETVSQGCYPKVGGGPFSVRGLYKGTNDGCLPAQGLNYDNHPGYDYVAEVGVPVKAAARGTVVKVVNKRKDGEVYLQDGICVPKGIDKQGCAAWGFVGIDHGNGYVTQYGHLSRIDVVAGQSITEEGQQIGLSGQTSPPYTDKNGKYPQFSVDPHLHFEVLKANPVAPYGYSFVDPYGWEDISGKEDYLGKVTGIQNVILWKGDRDKDDIRRIDANAVWIPSEQALKQIIQSCGSLLDREVERRCVVSEMRKLGATNQAVSFTELMKDEAYMTHFRESGKVDLAQVCQFVYNDPELCGREILVNGLPVIVDPYDYVFDIDLRGQSAYSSIARRFPEVTISPRYSFLVVRPLTKGGQQFVFVFMLMNGCRACEIAGSALVGFDFDQSGRFTGTKLTGLKEVEAIQVPLQTSPVAVAQDWAPSFDCAKATTSPERMICSNKELAEADVRMVQLYKAARNNSPNKEALTREQNNWRKNVRDACADTTCMLRAYQDRIAHKHWS